MKYNMVSLNNTALIMGVVCLLETKLCFAFQPSSIIPTGRIMPSVSSILESTKEDLSIIEGGSNPPNFEGSDMKITEYPHPVLRRMGDDISNFRSDDLRQLCKE